MPDGIQKLKQALGGALRAQEETTIAWHETGVVEQETGTDELSLLRDTILKQHARNFQLWHVEDEARRTDVPDSVIADCKRRIDGLNQKRNDLIEAVDGCLADILSPLLPDDRNPRINTETPGLAIDRLSILALKKFHMAEQLLRSDVAEDHIVQCRTKLEVLSKQRQRLEQALMDLIDEYASGLKSPSLYSQFKMYNDPSLNPQLYGGKKAAGTG